jgi:hypothetical protein
MIYGRSPKHQIAIQTRMMKYISLASSVGMAATVVLFSAAANAVTFTGYDENKGSTPLTTATSPNSQAAFANFSSNLNSALVTTESFENFSTTAANPTPIDGLSTTISGVTATFSYKTKTNPAVSASGDVQKAAASGASQGFTNSGTYPTDGVKGISINSANNFSISFNNSLAAFSYFGTDLGDFNNILTMEFYSASTNGTTLVKSIVIPSNVGSANSSEFFFGFIADSQSEEFNTIKFISSLNGDAIGIDQIKIATPAQRLSTQAPEPATIIGTLIGAGYIRRIKRRQQLDKLSNK